MTRRYFGTDGVRATVGTFPMTPDFVMLLGQASGRVIRRENAGRKTTGYPIFPASFTASSTVFAIADGKTGSPNSSHNSLNNSRSSARSILLLLVPNSSV